MVERSISISRADVHKHTDKESAVKVQGVGLTIYAYFQSDDGKEVTLFAEKPDGDNYVKRFAKSGTTNINFDDGKTAIHRVKVNIPGQIPQPIEQSYVTINDVIKENASDKGIVVGMRESLYDNGSTQVIKPSGNVYDGYKLQGGNQTIKVNGDMTVTFVYMKESNTGGYVPLNLDTLRSTLTSADNLKEGDYIASTWEAMTKVRTASRKTLIDGVTQNDNKSGSMTQATINTANTNLQNAIKNLVKPVAPVRLNVATLQASVTKFDNLNEAIYTPASWKPLSVSGATGKTILTKAIVQNSSNAQASPNDLTQAQVNTASANIEANIKKLVLAEVFIPIKTEELVKALAVANKVNRELYTTKSYSDLQDTMMAGADVIDLASDINDEETIGTDTQAKVDQAKADIEKALTQLEALIKLNTTGIAKALETADLFNEADYTQESWSVFADAKENAKQAEIRATAQNNQQQPQTMTQAQLNTATTSLTNAQKGLVANGTVNDLDTSALEAELVVAESIENDGYTEYSWAAFVSQIDYSKGILQLAETSSTLTQSDIDFAVTLLQLTQEELTKEEVAPLDYAVLQSDVNKANSIKDIGYTERSWGNFTEARTVANEVLKDAMSTNPTVTQENINRAEMNLSIAKNNLKLEPIVLDATQLSKAVNDAKKLNEGEYTKASWSAFATAFVEAESQVYFASQGTTTQVNIDNALKSLNTAVKNLVKVDIPAPSLPLQLTGFKTAVTKANAIKNDGYTNATWSTFNNARNASNDLLARA
ncbi:FIVAR domain-containing protein [Brochothrix thermosphacta]|uniref:FIVAR domain-containing protein n=1 Tax=Brochothrix thermosphacta TaxID=2756 RepID=UPI00083F8032|nr:FIVAR domain-containing protein [Brochothrix thermosphacta]ODJ51747.1 hypothetical protein BFR40_07025 [Brochothrix thermosphacta]ODJ61370.1 hypothetical protein BFR35_12185 [Brochothrix thermosphacta]